MRCRLACVAGLLLVSPDAAEAQGDVTAVSVGALPLYQRWSFGTPIDQDTLRVTGISQLAVPVSVFVPLGERFTLDAVGAYVRGRVELEGGDDLTLDGLADVRVRLVGRLRGDNVLLTAGLTLPTGTTGLSGSGLDALRLTGAPSLRLPVPALGTGFGATLGLVLARQAGPWALALGTSYELRGTYSPIESIIAGVTSATDLNPGDALHVSLGADRLLGQSRLALLLAGDVYGDDRITAGESSSRLTSSYRLGPTIRALAQLDLAIRGYREFAVYAQVRHRTPFTGIDGAEVDGSTGTVFDVGVSTVRGRPRGVGLVLRADAMIDSGLEVDNSLATAGATVLGATVGLSVPLRRGVLEPFVRLQRGRFDTGPAETAATGLAFGVTLGGR